jgi:UDP-N-acetylmuramate dehydrogenase
LRVSSRADPAAVSVRLADLTTLRVGGPAALHVADSDAEVVDVVRGCDAERRPVLILGGGSNVVVADEGVEGVVVRIATSGVSFRPEGDRVGVTAAAGETWDDVVVACLAEGLAGVETLSGIPGLVGATPLQNVGAYGTELSDVVSAVTVLDRDRGDVADLTPGQCAFGYRTSALKRTRRQVVLSVTLSLERTPQSLPVRYAELAREMGVDVGARVPAGTVRAAVLALRARKGMIVDPADPDSVSVGSFFTNPVVPAAAAPVDAPCWPAPEGMVKVSAAWLIENAGFGRGFGTGRVGLSTKHTLAVVNRGGATASEVVAFARELRDGVRARFGVELQPEPAFVGIDW